MKSRTIKSAIVACALLFAPLAPFAPDAKVSAAGHPVTILFNGEALASDAQPFIVNGTTFVPFRVIFEHLGMEVNWDPAAKTVTGRDDAASISLTVGSLTADVNGEERQLLEAPRIVDGRTFVPLRFVSESASAAVQWDGATRTVAVISAAQAADKAEETEKAKQDVLALYQEYIAASNREDVQAIRMLLHPESPFLNTVGTVIADAFQRRDVVTLVEFSLVERIGENSALLLVTEVHEKTSGAFYVNNRTESRVEMRKVTGGSWKLFDIKVLSQEWLSPFGPGMGQAATAVDEGDETIARNTISAYLEALNQENIQAALRIVHPESPMRKATETSLSYMFETYDLVHELEKLHVVERSADELYVYTVQTMKKLDGPKLSDVRTEAVHTLRRLANGQWKLYSTINGNTETLSIPR